MKKITALLLGVTMLCSATAYADEELVSADGMYKYIPSSGVIMQYYGGELAVMPSKIDGTEIKEIGERCCFDLGIKIVDVKDGIEIINESAFEGCNVCEVIVPQSLNYIGDMAFANCSQLVYFELKSENISFGGNAFLNTPYMQFGVKCNAETENLTEKIVAAKGDDKFEFVLLHNWVSDTDENFYCGDCGIKAGESTEELDNPFEDVPADSWYCKYVKLAYDSGIIMGKSDAVFDPDEGMTLAEAAAIAARIREVQYREYTTFEQNGEHWYDVYVDYCYRNGIIGNGVVFDWEKKATRAEMAYIFSRCDLSEYYLNDVPITDIPDVKDDPTYSGEILDLYNKGIAVGSDEHMTYYPDADITRSEAAAIVTRIIYPNMRIELPKG